MRIRYPIQQKLGTVPISEVSISLKSRDELPATLKGLQYIFSTPSLRESILDLLNE